MRLTLKKMASLALVFVSLLGGRSVAAADYGQVIFIPGLMGSTLVNERGEEVWGSLKSADKHFEELAFPLDETADKINSKAILGDVTAYLGIWKKPVYSPVTSILEKLLTDKYTGFHYDWRQSNFRSACDLRDFISGSPKLKAAAEGAQGITLITHSMGGIIGRIFLDYYVAKGTQPAADNTCPHSYKVKLFMPIAAPFNGAGHALKTLTEEPALYWKFIRWDEAKVLSVFFTIPSVYELLPRYPGCCLDAKGIPLKALDLFSVSTWTNNRWIPTALHNIPKDKIQGFIQSRLDAAIRLRNIIAKPIPAHTRLFALWGYNMKTSTTVKVLASSSPNKPETDWSSIRDGDDTVPELSALHCKTNEFGGTEPCNIAPDLQAIGNKMWRFPSSHLGLLAFGKVHESIKFVLNRYARTDVSLDRLDEEDDEVPDELQPFLMSSSSLDRLDEGELAKVEFQNSQQLLQENSTQTVLFNVIGESGEALPLSEADKLGIIVETAAGERINGVRIATTSVKGQFGAAFQTPSGLEPVTVRIEGPVKVFTSQNGKEIEVRPTIEGIFPVVEKQR